MMVREWLDRTLSVNGIDRYSNKHTLYTLKGSQSKEGDWSQVKTRHQTKMKSCESTWILPGPVKSLNPEVWYRPTAHISEAQKGMREMPEDWKWTNAVMKRKKYRPHQQKTQSMLFLDPGQLAGSTRLTRPEAASWLYSDSLLLLPPLCRLLGRKNITPPCKATRHCGNSTDFTSRTNPHPHSSLHIRMNLAKFFNLPETQFLYL